MLPSIQCIALHIIGDQYIFVEYMIKGVTRAHLFFKKINLAMMCTIEWIGNIRSSGVGQEAIITVRCCETTIALLIINAMPTLLISVL